MGATAFRGMDDRVSSNVISPAQTALELFADPLVARATSWSDFCWATSCARRRRSPST